MDVQNVLNRFRLISGLTTAETVPWLPVCSEAVQEIESKLKPNVTNDTQSERLCAAAAALTFYRYTLYRVSGGGMESFQAGDISVSSDRKECLQTAQSMWNETKASVADLLEDDGFVFCGVIA